MHCLWGFHAGECVAGPHHLFTHGSSLSSPLRCGCGLHRHEINVNAGFSPAAPAACCAQLEECMQPVSAQARSPTRTHRCFSFPTYFKYRSQNAHPAVRSSGFRGAPASVHVGAFACAHTRESWSPWGLSSLRRWRPCGAWQASGEAHEGFH